MLKKERKATGSASDFSVFFNGVLSIKQSHLLLSYRAALSSFCRDSLCTSFTRSSAVFPFLDLISRGAPLMSKALRGLPVFNYSELLTAR